MYINRIIELVQQYLPHKQITWSTPVVKDGVASIDVLIDKFMFRIEWTPGVYVIVTPVMRPLGSTVAMTPHRFSPWAIHETACYITEVVSQTPTKLGFCARVWLSIRLYVFAIVKWLRTKS